MKFKSLLVALAVATIGFSAQADHRHHDKKEKAPDIEKMEKQAWADVQAKHWDAINALLADGFQGVHHGVTENKKGQIKFLKDLKLGAYKLNHFHVTGEGRTYVVTYMAKTSETEAGLKATKKAMPRLTVWHKTDKGWQVIAHANLNP